MPSAVRRMVCDIQVKWLLLGGVLALIILMLDGLWLIHPDSAVPLSAGFMLGMPAISVASVKAKVWRLLPVSSREIARVQWWLGVGGPLILILSILALAIIVVGLVGAIRASPLAIAAFAGAECAPAIAIPVIAYTVSVAANKGGPRAAVPAALLCACALAAIAFSRPSLTPTLGTSAGAAAIAIAAAAYFHPPLVVFGQSRAQMRGRTIGASRPGAGGWAALARPFLNSAAGLAFLSVALFVCMKLVTSRTNSLVNPVAMSMAMAMLAMVSATLGGQARQSARVLRGLPISSAALTSVLLCASAAAQLLAFAVLYLVCFLYGGAPAEMLVLLPLAVGFGVFGFGLMLRRRGSAMAALGWPLFTIAGSVLFYVPALAPGLIAAGLVGVPIGWLLTFQELSRGHSAYQGGAFSIARWRGS